MRNTQVKLSDAELWTKIWRIACPTNCKAFSIPVQDLVGVLKEIGVLVRDPDNKELYSIDESTINGVRAYMAIDPNESNGGGEKLLIVGTHPVKDQKTGKTVQRDIINGKIDNKGPVIYHPTYLTDVEGDDDDKTGIYDFTNPCPDVCDDDSPLIGG